MKERTRGEGGGGRQATCADIKAREEKTDTQPSAACKAARIYIFISPFTTIFKYMRKKIEFEAAAPAVRQRLFSLFHTHSSLSLSLIHIAKLTF
jgi:hypothetical protein